MKLAPSLYSVRCFFERNVMVPIRFFLAGNVLVVTSLIVPPHMLGNYSISNIILGAGIFIAVIALVMFACMAVVLALVDSASPEKREMLVNEIKSLKKEISFLQSEHWLEMVKESLGTKFNRITSQQYLILTRHLRTAFVS